jgi:hypothetical protein
LIAPEPTKRGTAPLLGAVASLVEEASHAVGSLKGAGGQLPNPLMLIRPFLRGEAVLSSRIEGT